MILLTFNAAIFHKLASGTKHQFNVVHRCFAARSTCLIGLCVAHDDMVIESGANNNYGTIP
jgi:hypothetical protein